MEPQKDDLVRVTYETTVQDADGFYSGRYLRSSSHVTNHSVEVIEPADDPSKDPVGTVRDGADPGMPMIKVRPGRWVQVVDRGSGIEVHDDAFIAAPGWRKIIGTVPGTPAHELKAREFDALPGYGSLK